MAAIDDLNSQRFYHGTKADLKPGDLIEPGYNSNPVICTPLELVEE